MSLRLRPRSFPVHHLAPPPSCRYLTTTSPPTLPPSAGCAHLSSRRLLLLSGPSSAHFLQGLTTRTIPPAQSLSSQDPRSGFYAAFLNASGRVLHDVFIYPGASPRTQNDESAPSFMIEVDAQEAERLACHLKRFKLRAKVDVRVLDPDEASVWSLWPSPISSLEASPTALASCADTRAPDMGARVLLPGGRKPDLDAEEVHERSYMVRRMLRGVAEGQGEILREASLPLESNMDYMGGVDFRKGCYVGQELTIRTRHTGVVRKRILPVQLYNSPPAPEKLLYDPTQQFPAPPQGMDIKRVDGRGRSTGRWLGGVGNVGLALCRLHSMVDGQEGEFRMVWGGEDEQEGREVRVKAFVPGWHRERGGGDGERDSNLGLD